MDTIEPVRAARLARVAGLFTLFVALLGAYLLIRPGPLNWLKAIDNVAQFVGPLLAIPLCLDVPLPFGLGGGGRGAYRTARLLLALSIISETVGQVIFTYYEQVLGHTAPFPSWADAAYLTLYPSMFAAILVLTRRPNAMVRGRLALDGIAVMTAVAAFSWYFIVEPTYAGGAESIFAKVVGAVYPAFDLLLIACLLLLWSQAGNKTLRPAIGVLGLALGIIITTDTIFDYQTLRGTYGTGELLDIGWPMGFMVVGLAAAILRTAPPAARTAPPLSAFEFPNAPPLWQSLLPYALMPPVAALALYASQQGTDGEARGVYIAAVVLVLLVMARHVLTVLDNTQLYHHLSDAYTVQGVGLAHRVRELEWLRDVSGQVNAAATLEEVLDVAYDGVRDGLGFDRVGINLFDQEAGTFEDRIGTDAAGKKFWPSDRVLRLAPDSPIWRYPGLEVLMRGEPYFYSEHAYDECPPELRYLYDGNPTHNLMVPLHAGNRVMGYISVDNLLTERPVLLHNVDPLIALANQVGLAVERKRTEAALRASEARLLAVMLKAPIVLFTTDDSGLFTMVIGSASHLLGVEADNLQGRSLHEVCANRPDLIDDFRRAQQGDTFTATIQAQGRTLEVHWMPQRQDGAVDAVVGVIVDVTERALAQQEAELARAAAESLAYLRSDFVASVSHELRTPLTAIIGYAELLQTRWSQLDDAQRLDRIGRIVSASNRQQRMVEDLLLITRLEVGALAPRVEPAQLSALVDRAADEVRSSYRGQCVNIAGQTDLTVLVDAERTLQILVNVIDNAAKYSPEGAAIDVRWEREELMATVHVRDYGTGIPLVGREHLFTRFGRVPSSRTRSGRVGTGLGLHLGRSLALAMGGDLDLESTGPTGSIFRLRLPLAPVAALAAG